MALIIDKTLDNLEGATEIVNPVEHLEVTTGALERKCLLELNKQGRLNDITRTMVSNIISLQETASQCKESIEKYGVMIESIGSTGQPVIKRNEAVNLQDKAVTSMAKLLAQLELDSIVEDVESEI